MSIDSVFSISLHDEILIEIFSRVPAKSVGRFRCLSKTWLTNLTTSHFIKLHLSRNTNQQSLILLNQSNLHTIKPPFFENSTELDLGKGTWRSLLCSCNGIVLAINKEKDILLVNPITLEQFKVPSIDNGWSGIGFGYDSFSHDYKILTLRKSHSTGIIEVDMYSLKRGIWRSISHSLNSFFWFGVFINGCINWINYTEKPGVLFTILAFDLATEVFREIDVPMNCFGPRLPCGRCTFFAHQGCLCALVPVDNNTDEIWMMEEYGKVNSWTKLASVDQNGEWWMHELLWIDEKQVVLIALEYVCNEEIPEVTMTEYNLQDGTVKKMVVNGEVASFCGGLSFVDSLVSLREFTSAS